MLRASVFAVLVFAHSLFMLINAFFDFENFIIFTPDNYYKQKWQFHKLHTVSGNSSDSLAQDFVTLRQLCFQVAFQNVITFPLQKYLEEYLNGLLENAFCRNDHSMVITWKHRHT